MNKAKAFLTLILSALGIFGANAYYKPKNVKDLLKWRGVKLASGNRAWESMYFENEEELKVMKIDSANELWSWCSERFKQHNLSDENELSVTKKFCSDSVTSIMGRIIKEGEEFKLIEQDDKDAFSINYLLSENKDEIVSLIEFSGEHNPILIGQKMSEWCQGQRKVKITSSENLDTFSNFKKRCYNRGVKTVSELLKKQGKRVIGQEEYKQRFNGKLEYVEELKREIMQFLNENDGKKKKELVSLMKMSSRVRDWDEEPSEEQILKEHGWRLYKSWCEEKIRGSLLDLGMYPSTYGKVVYRCTENGPN